MKSPTWKYMYCRWDRVYETPSIAPPYHATDLCQPWWQEHCKQDDTRLIQLQQHWLVLGLVCTCMNHSVMHYHAVMHAAQLSLHSSLWTVLALPHGQPTSIVCCSDVLAKKWTWRPGKSPHDPLSMRDLCWLVPPPQTSLPNSIQWHHGG